MTPVPSLKVGREDFIDEIQEHKETLPFFHVLGAMDGPRLFQVHMELHSVIIELIERGAWEDILVLMQVREYAESVNYYVSATYVLLQILKEPLPDQFNRAVLEAKLEPANILDVICFLRAYPEYVYFFTKRHLLATGSAWRRKERLEGEETEGYSNGWQIPHLPLQTDSSCSRLGMRIDRPAVISTHDSTPRDDSRNYALARLV